MRETKNPNNDEWEPAFWIDDYFGPHRYGVKFDDGKIYRPEELEARQTMTHTFNIEVTDPTEQKIVVWYSNLMLKALEKFRKGRAEHGDDTSGLDYKAEIRAELTDIINYYLMDGKDET